MSDDRIVPVRVDPVDRLVYSATLMVRQQYVKSCHELGITPRQLSPVQIGMRSVR